ncbi:MAG: hypothetical protein COA82_09760 [Alkaliphilus sp.]|nr:MAG: hypothetical protein COA82_09760 [Alkaliphilus sp.]
MKDDEFKVAVIRPPIVYGKNCRGNYPRLAKMALRLPIFSNIDNERSMIYIDNLSEFIRILINNSSSGLFFPQNKSYVNTTELVRLIAKVHGKEIKTTKLFNWCVSLGIKKSAMFRKVFGSLVYEKEMIGGPKSLMRDAHLDYEMILFDESIKCTEH